MGEVGSAGLWKSRGVSRALRSCLKYRGESQEVYLGRGLFALRCSQRFVSCQPTLRCLEAEGCRLLVGRLGVCGTDWHSLSQKTRARFLLSDLRTTFLLLYSPRRLRALREGYRLAGCGTGRSNFLPVSVPQAVVLWWAKYPLATGTIKRRRMERNRVLHVSSSRN